MSHENSLVHTYIVIVTASANQPGYWKFHGERAVKKPFSPCNLPHIFSAFTPSQPAMAQPRK